MDKKQAEAVSDVVMSQAKADQARKRERRVPKTINPWWRVLGLGFLGAGLGMAFGTGNELVYAVTGFGIGIAAGALIFRPGR